VLITGVAYRSLTCLGTRSSLPVELSLCQYSIKDFDSLAGAHWGCSRHADGRTDSAVQWEIPCLQMHWM
jgi:hypothetical protein